MSGEPAKGPVKVLYVLGSARSGSTVFANLVGELPDFFSAGEVRFLWERSLQDRLCGCGEPVGSCPIWSGVLKDLEIAGTAPAEEIVRIDHSRLRAPGLPSLLRGSSRADTDRSAYEEAIRVALRSLAARTGARIIVDSSKRPTNGAALLHLDGIEVSFVHLIRDARAVAASRSVKKPNPDRPGGFLGGTSVLDSCVHWAVSNGGSDLVRRAAGARRALVLRYEDFVDEPARALTEVGRLLGEPVDPSLVVSGREMRLGTNHAVSGNPDRFVSGPVPLRKDERWRTSLSRAERFTTEIVCSPLLLRYGYRLRGTRSAAR